MLGTAQPMKLFSLENRSEFTIKFCSWQTHFLKINIVQQNQVAGLIRENRNKFIELMLKF